jgi:hypothetical protein
MNTKRVVLIVLAVIGGLVSLILLRRNQMK